MAFASFADSTPCIKMIACPPALDARRQLFLDTCGKGPCALPVAPDEMVHVPCSRTIYFSSDEQDKSKRGCTFA